MSSMPASWIGNFSHGRVEAPLAEVLTGILSQSLRRGNPVVAIARTTSVLRVYLAFTTLVAAEASDPRILQIWVAG